MSFNKCLSGLLNNLNTLCGVEVKVSLLHHSLFFWGTLPWCIVFNSFKSASVGFYMRTQICWLKWNSLAQLNPVMSACFVRITYTHLDFCLSGLIGIRFLRNLSQSPAVFWSVHQSPSFTPQKRKKKK